MFLEEILMWLTDEPGYLFYYKILVLGYEAKSFSSIELYGWTFMVFIDVNKRLRLFYWKRIVSSA